MKKKVRIYKALDGQGAVINKTSKFLKKAQEGGMPNVDQMGYPGEQANQEQMSQEQLAQSIISDISNGKPKEETVIRLVSIFGQEPMIADQYYEQVYNALRSQQDSEEEEADEDSPYKPIQEDIEQEQAIEESFWYPDENETLSNEIATEDEEEDYSDDDFAADLIMQFGGVSPVIVPMRQDGGEAYPIQFPGVEAYLPFNMNEMLSGNTDALTGQAWSPQEEEQAAVAPDDEVQADFRKGGQYKKDKRVYVNSMLKLAKKQMGGEDVNKKSDTDPRGEDVRKERLNAFLGTIKNESQMAKAKEQAEQQFDQMMQQQQQMPQYPMQQQFADEGLEVESSVQGMDRDPGFAINPKTGKPWSKSEWDNRVISGCFGGNCLPDESEIGILPGQSDIIGIPKGKAKSGTPPYIQGYPVPNIYGNQIPMRRGIFGRPKMPRGVGFGYGAPITKLDVRRTGIFGRPKEYSMEFGPYSPMPGMPGSGAGFYGYGQTTKKTTKTKGRIITETVATTVNNKSIEDVAKATDSNAANTSAQNWDKDNNGIPDTIQANPITAGTNTNSTPNWVTDPIGTAINASPTPGSGVLSNNPVTPNTTANNVQVNTATSNKRKGVNVNNEAADAVINNSNAKREETEQKNAVQQFVESKIRPSGKRDKWGRPKSSKWYGFDPKKKVYTQGSNNQYIEPGTSAYWNMTPEERNANTMLNVNQSFGYQEGGIINDPMQDQFGNLQQFVYGGDDEYFTQEDLDDVYSKDTSDPYFQNGGGYEDYRKRVGDKLQMSLRDDLSAKELFEMGQKAGVGFDKDSNTTTTKKKTTTTTSNKQNNPYANIGYNGFNAFGNLFPANIASYQGSWGKVKKGPYNKATGAMMPGMGFGPNSQVRSIDVTKSGMFGRPKKYTINYGNQEMDPRKQNLITLPGKEASDGNGNAGQNTSAAGTFSNTKGLKAGSRAKVAMKELFNRYNDQEEIPTGDVASTSNAPSSNQGSISDEEEVAKFQHQQRKNGKRWDEAKQAWVNAEQIRMDLKKPSLLGPSESLTRSKYEEAIKAQGSKADQNRPIGNAAYEERNRRISPSKEKLNKLYSRDLMEQQYGGGLHRFVGGGDSPVTYTDNPALVGMSNVDMISLNEGIPGLQQSSFWGDQASFNKETPVNTQKQPEQIKTDPTQISSDQAKKAYQATPGNFSVDVKNKNMYEVDPEAALATANAGIRGVTGMLDRFKNKKSEAKMYDNLTADNLYAADPSRDAGDYDVNTGLYRPNEQGAVHTSRSAQYGGNANYSEGDVIDMTEEELEEFLANGGEVEYLNY